MNLARVAVAALPVLLALPLPAQQPPPAEAYKPTDEERRRLDERRRELVDRVKLIPDNNERKADAVVFLQVAAMADRLELYRGPRDTAEVLRGLEIGLQRCDQILKGESPWTTAPGRHLRGYLSTVDGSVQPYGVVIPRGYGARSDVKWRLDVVLHGRGPDEISFLRQFEPAAEPPPTDAPDRRSIACDRSCVVPAAQAPPAGPPDQLFVELHPFGRGNNGWRWAGETDVFEALAATMKQYSIDPNRVILRGFSMGGHGAWHLGLHHPQNWAAVSPGAGFTDTRRYLKIEGQVPEYQERLWNIYDPVACALNLANTPFIAYSGDRDPQIQAARNMEEEAAKLGLKFNHLIGPNTEHRYHPQTLEEIMRRLALRERDARPLKLRFTTWTLKYPRCYWILIDAMFEHHRRAVVEADATGEFPRLRTENVKRLALDPLPKAAFKVEVDGQVIDVEPLRPVYLLRRGEKWSRSDSYRELHKRPRVMGPIDDAFTRPFLVVVGTGTPWNPLNGAYAQQLLERMRKEWRLGFRGELNVIPDTQVSRDEPPPVGMVLLGDPGSNSVLRSLVGKLPIRWTKEGLQMGGEKYDANHFPVMVFPHPLNNAVYLVINSGHTFTERDLLASNANLTPKLPDWAVMRHEAAAPVVVDAGFFTEEWRMPRRAGRD